MVCSTACAWSAQHFSVPFQCLKFTSLCADDDIERRPRRALEDDEPPSAAAQVSGIRAHPRRSAPFPPKGAAPPRPIPQLQRRSGPRGDSPQGSSAQSDAALQGSLADSPPGAGSVADSLALSSSPPTPAGRSASAGAQRGSESLSGGLEQFGQRPGTLPLHHGEVRHHMSPTSNVCISVTVDGSAITSLNCLLLFIRNASHGSACRCRRTLPTRAARCARPACHRRRCAERRRRQRRPMKLRRHHRTANWYSLSPAVGPAASGSFHYYASHPTNSWVKTGAS